jgi:hypothetical protein
MLLQGCDFSETEEIILTTLGAACDASDTLTLLGLFAADRPVSPDYDRIVSTAQEHGIFSQTASINYLRRRLIRLLLRDGILSQEGDGFRFSQSRFESYFIAVHLAKSNLPARSFWKDVDPFFVGIQALNYLASMWNRDDSITDLTPLLEAISERGDTGIYIAANILSFTERCDSHFVSRLLAELSYRTARSKSLLMHSKGPDLLGGMARHWKEARKILERWLCVPSWLLTSDRIRAGRALTENVDIEETIGSLIGLINTPKISLEDRISTLVLLGDVLTQQLTKSQVRLLRSQVLFSSKGSLREDPSENNETLIRDYILVLLSRLPINKIYNLVYRNPNACRILVLSTRLMDICKKVLKDSSSLDEKIQAAAVLGSIGFEEDETIALQKLIQSEKLSTDHMCGIARRLLQLEHTELARSLLMWAEENKGNKSAMRIEDLEVQLQLLHLGEDSRIDPMALALSEKIPERFRCSCIRYLLAHDRRENAVKCFHSLPSESGSFGAIFKDRIALSLLET